MTTTRVQRHYVIIYCDTDEEERTHAKPTLKRFYARAMGNTWRNGGATRYPVTGYARVYRLHIRVLHDNNVYVYICTYTSTTKRCHLTPGNLCARFFWRLPSFSLVIHKHELLNLIPRARATAYTFWHLPSPPPPPPRRHPRTAARRRVRDGRRAAAAFRSKNTRPGRPVYDGH